MKLEKFILGIGIILFLLVFTQCNKDEIILDEFSVKTSELSNKKKVDSDEESAGNCLSFPVIWSDGVTKELRGDQEVDPIILGDWWYVWGEDPYDPQQPLYSVGPYSNDETPPPPPDEPDLYKAFIQKDLNNVWQASNWIPDGATAVDYIDWGDNLESIDWNIKSQVRTEVVLYEKLTEYVTEYSMRHCYSWGEDEVHGLQTDLENQVIYGLGNEATVFTPNARLTIQKFADDVDLEGIAEKLKWIPTVGWTEVQVNTNLINNTPLFNMAVHEASDGPGYYNAEVNVKGKVIYGYTWNVRKLNEGIGYYRITFSFDDNSGIDLKTSFDEETYVYVVVDEDETEHKTTSLSTVDDGDSGEGIRGGEGIVDSSNNLTYMDILIIDKNSGGGGGNGGGGNNH